MSFTIILIIIAFTDAIHSLVHDYDDDFNASLYNISLFRYKRSPIEYTRWRPNQVTTSEFIVKVLDDEIQPTSTKQVVAVNILPSAKNADKIIIGGAVVPSPTTALTVTPSSKSDIQSFPVQGLFKKEPPYPQYKFGRAPHRDESPPASPQFIARTPTLLARQYAPITSVLFTQRTSDTLLTPPVLKRTFPDIRLKPTRTSPLPDISSQKVFFENDFNNHAFEEEDLNLNEISVSRSTHFPMIGPKRVQTVDIIYAETSKTSTTIDSLSFKDYATGRKKMFDNGKKIDDEKEIDSPYGMMFYIEDDNEGTEKSTMKNKDESEAGISEELNSDSYTIDRTEIGFVDVTEVYELERNNHLEADGIKNTLTSPKFNETMIIAEEWKRTQVMPLHNCSLLQYRPLSFKSARTLPEIVAQLRYWAEHSPVAKWVDITAGNYTLMENPIYMMIVDDPSSGQIISAKQTVMVVAGIQGRDHHAVSAALYVLYQLIERTDVHTDLLSKYRFWIIPVFNPDGYDYSITFPQRREWTKNLRQNWQYGVALDACSVFGLRCSIKPCYGVNLDRNFEYQWIPPDELRAEHPCGELYAGTRQLSEVETMALTRYLHIQRVPLHTFVAFKEGDVLGIMYPYSHTKKSRAFDHVYRQRASRAASAAYGISGRPYVAGQTSQFLPLYAGGIEDWVDGHLGIDNTYTVMMFRPTDSYNAKYATESFLFIHYTSTRSARWGQQPLNKKIIPPATNAFFIKEYDTAVLMRMRKQRKPYDFNISTALTKICSKHVVHEAYAALDTLLLHSTEPVLGPPVITLSKSTGNRYAFHIPIVYVLCSSMLNIVTGIRY